MGGVDEMEPKSTLMDEAEYAAKLVVSNKLILVPLVINWLIGILLGQAFAPSIVAKATAGQVWNPEMILYLGCNLVLSLVVVSGVSYTAFHALQGESFSWTAFWSGIKRFFLPMMLATLGIGIGLLFITLLATPIVMMSPVLVGLFIGVFTTSFFYLWQVVMVSDQLGFSDTVEQSLAFLKRNFWSVLGIGASYVLTSALVSLLKNPNAHNVAIGGIRTSISPGWPSIPALITGLLMLGVDMVIRQWFFVHYARHRQIREVGQGDGSLSH